ncbi:MAG: PLP-dependent transferase [Oligoflexales bacterium]|nr:PLP-dependent transferase [Oligoflexales bacterium]
MKFATKAIHVGNTKDPITGPIVPPVHFASTYVQKEAGVEEEYDYSRSGNPTRTAFQKTIASLEDAYGALAFSSGMAASHGVMMLLNSGDHIVVSSDI